MVIITNSIITTLGRLTFRRENGLSYNALGPFRLLVELMLLSLSMMLCMSMVGSRAKHVWMIFLAFNCRVSDLASRTTTLFTCEMQRSDGLNLTTWGQVHMKGSIIPWLLSGHVSLCLEDLHQAHGWMRFTFLIQVCTFVLSFHLDSLPSWEHRGHQVPGTRG